MKFTFIYTYWDGKTPITGSHFYELRLMDTLRDLPGVEVECIKTDSNKSRLTKLLAPLASLKLLFRRATGSHLVFNSAQCAYFLPLSLLCRLAGKTSVGMHHHFMHRLFTGRKHRFYKFFEMNFLRSFDKIIVPNPYVYDDMLALGFPASKMLLWQNVCDLKPVTDVKPEKGRLCFTGSIEYRKGLKYLAEALAILKGKGLDFHLDVMGKVVDQAYYEELKEYIRDKGLDVSFLGFVHDDVRDEIMKKSDLFVFPSLLEGFGRVLVEANCYGLPVICFDNTAMPYTVKNMVNGLLVEDRNAAKMAEAIELASNDRQLRARLSEGAYQAAKNAYTQQDFLDDIKSGLPGLQKK